MGKLSIRQGTSIQTRPVEWLWKGRIPRNKVTLIQGDGGEGKSTFSLSFAAGLSVGTVLPTVVNGEAYDSESCEPMNIFYVSTEDESEDTALPRFLRAGGDRERYFDNDEKETHFELTEEYFNEVYEACKPGLMIIDPYQSFLPEGLSLGTIGQMRQTIAMMMRFAAKKEVTILLVGHLNKNEGGKDIHRGYGSGDIAAALRNIIKIEVDEQYPWIRRLEPVKCNLDGSASDPIEIQQDEGNRFVVYDMQVDDSKNRIKQAMTIIHNHMKDGRAILSEVDKEIKQSGISESTYYRARKKYNLHRVEINGIEYLCKRRKHTKGSDA